MPLQNVPGVADSSISVLIHPPGRRVFYWVNSIYLQKSEIPRRDGLLFAEALPYLRSKMYGLHILLADDDGDDQVLFREAVEASFGAVFSIDPVNNGVEVLRRLDNASRDLPDVIVLDVNMPLKDGVSTLREIKNQERYRHIPVFMLSTSKKPGDIDTCLQLGCSMFYTKPYHIKEYTGIVVDIVQRSLHQSA